MENRKLERLDAIIKRLHRLGRVGWSKRKGPGTTAFMYGHWYDRAITLRYYLEIRKESA